MERETGFEPATNSLEGCDSTPELLPQNSLPNGGEWRIRTSVGRGPADLQSAAFDRSANSPRKELFRCFWSWRRDSNPRPADYKSAALPTELCQHQFLNDRFQRHNNSQS